MIRPPLPCAVFLFALVFSGCSSDLPASQDATPPGYLRLAESDDVPTLDPARGYDVASWQFEDMLFQTLLDYDEQGELVAEAAAEWHVSPDGRVYRFRLRPDLRFSNGRQVVAADFAYAIERTLDPATRSPGAEFYRGLRGSDACERGACRVTGIRIIAPDTLELELLTVDPLFAHKLAMPFSAAIPQEEVAKWQEDFGRHPVGSGPFVLEEWKAGQYLRLRRNPDFVAARTVRLAGIERRVGVSDELAWFQYEAGELDVSEIPPAEFPRVMADSSRTALLRHVITLRTHYLGMNCLLAPFDKLPVRQAINHAIDRKKLLALLNQRGVVAHGILPPAMPGYDAAARGYIFDRERARKLLQAAGLAAGLRTTLWVRLDGLTLRLAQSIQQDLAEVDVHITIKPLAWGPFLEAVRRHDEVPMFLLGWEADFPDPSNFLETLFHSRHIGTNNNTNYANPTVDTLLDQAAHETNPTRRIHLLQRAEHAILADAPWAPLYHPVTYQILNPRVRDYRLHPLRPARFDHTWLAGEPPSPLAALRSMTTRETQRRIHSGIDRSR